MSIKVNTETFDTMKEACERLQIARNTLLSYVRDGIVSEPPTVRRGKTRYRYFTEDWYQENEPKIKSL